MNTFAVNTIAIFLLAGTLTLSILPRASAAEDQIVIDDLTPTQLRAEISKIQNEFYRVFNASVTKPELTIVCHTYLPTGSNIKREACEPQFMIDRRAQNAADHQQQIDDLLSPAALQRELAPQFEELTNAMNSLAARDTYFRELNAILGMLRERLAEITN